MRKAFDEQLYDKVPINSLILFGIHLAINKGGECSFGELTKVCFGSFPKIFGLSDCQKWPDTRKLDRPLRTLRDRKLIAGNPQTSFSLTKQGKKIALEVTKLFAQKRLL